MASFSLTPVENKNNFPFAVCKEKTPYFNALQLVAMKSV